ncbi:MAG TPA: DEAD/DEAH box helicase [Solirubrobacteraceae bacterium]|nr:DEAD/DEAH box helicase [Solirubrobacteraceae bacterium]
MSTVPETEPWAALLQDGRSEERLVHDDVYPGRRGRLVPVPDELDWRVLQGLERAGIHELYAHQREALEQAFDGPTIVTTGTASGKSLCFQLPTLEVLTTDPTARALYLYPTKALAQDQARSFGRFGLEKAIRPAIYDGDTPRHERAAIRKRSNLIITNPDMLHVGILPHHGAWDDLFANLAFVVVDEAHVYRGVFGSHVANVLRRLRRAAAIHGTEPRFLLASATIANPVALAEGLTGLAPFALVDSDAAPRAPRRVAMWNPPLLDEQLGVRASALYEAAEVFSALVSAGARTICFMKSRKGVELILRHSVDRLPAELGERVAPYRAGYTPAQRHDIERRLTSGELLGVVATDALELGIDIGELDAAVCVTFPGTVASLRQMWGRAGRRGRGLAVYIAGEDALDQFFCRHPDEFLARPVEAAILDPDSPEIYGEHLLCAAHEAPLSDQDEPFLGSQWRRFAEDLTAAGFLRERVTGFVPQRADDYPAARVALRSASADSFVLLDAGSGEVLGTIEAGRAYSTVHEGAVYMHLGRSYHVLALDLAARRAVLEPFDGDYFTQAKRESMTYIERLQERRATCGVTLSYGSVVYTETVLGYQRKGLQDHAVIDFQSLDLPTVEFQTRALWYELDELIAAEQFPPAALLGSLHALEHGQIAVLPLIAMCDRWDIGGLSTNAHPQTGGPTIFIYDGHPGGVGITRRGYDQFERLVDDAQRLIGECPCRSGCPSCVQSPKCGNLNEPLHKAGALELLRRMTSARAGQSQNDNERVNPGPENGASG